MTTTNVELLGTKIRRLLKERGFTQLQFEEDTGIARSTIMTTQRKRRCRGWRKSTLLVIADYLCMTLDELVEGTDQEEVWCG